MDLSNKRMSFEFYPPKSFEGLNQLIDIAHRLSALSPAFFSVTFGAGGSTRQRTIETVTALKQKLGMPIAPHLACVGFDRHELMTLIEQYIAMGVNRLVALRGDLPSGMVSSGDFELASDLVKFIRVVTGNYFHIEVAAYPESHPQAATMQTDILNLKRKYEMGSNSAITQYFFNQDAYFYFMDECAKQQINMPIYPGIMPIMQYERLKRFSTVCGAEVPRWLAKRLESYGDDAEAVREFGLEFVGRLCERLLAGGAPGLHFYTLNESQACLGIFEHLAGSGGVVQLVTEEAVEVA
jgi:methylenetetrahydrofolate reductase (NADPH)